MRINARASQQNAGRREGISLRLSGKHHVGNKFVYNEGLGVGVDETEVGPGQGPVMPHGMGSGTQDAGATAAEIVPLQSLRVWAVRLGGGLQKV